MNVAANFSFGAYAGDTVSQDVTTVYMTKLA